jgi:C4-dicarboxylate-binding protein DctP
MKSTTIHRIVALAATAVVAAACGGDASLAEKSGGAAAPLTLRLGTVESEPIPYAPYVNEFVRAVEEQSGGSIDIDVAWEAVPWTPESEQTLATMVSDGDIDLALVPTRVWDKLGVTSLRALQAPFLVDSLDLLNAIVGSELTDEMFAGLDPLGVEGLALWPDALRHPLGFERPLLTAADFDGAQLVVPASDTSVRLFRALGADSADAEVAAGREAAFNIGDLYNLGTFTANITFYPKVNALVANAEVLESLSDDQRDALRQAAADTTAYAVATNRSEADLAAQYCADGGSVALADAADVTELAELAAPVVAELEDDDTTNRIIGEIRELKAETTTDPATAAARCGTVIEEVSDPTGPPSEVSELPDGVYRVERSLDELEAAGQSNAEGSTGIWTIEVDDGTYVMSCAPLDLPGIDCGNGGNGIVEAGYLRGTGNTVWFVYDVEMTSEQNGCQMPVSNEPGHCGGGAHFHVDWALDGDTLTFSNFGPENSGSDFTIEPWTRIEGADQPDTEVASFPEGVYRTQSPIDGVVTMEYRDGVWRHYGESGELDCESTYVVEDGRIWLTSSTDPALSCGNPAGYQFLDAAWTVEGDQLRFVDINSDRNAVAEFSLPWTRIDDASAPGDEEETSDSGG